MSNMHMRTAGISGLDLPIDPPMIDAICHSPVRGPWRTRSGEKLYVMFAQSIETVQATFLSQPSAEMERVGLDIRGLRIFCVRDLMPGSTGGNQFHRLRTEFSFVVNGSFIFECEDLSGQTGTYTVDRDWSIAIPPFVRHSFRTVLSGTLITLANTIFEPEDSDTHDTFSAEDFERLKAAFVSLRRACSSG